MHLPSHPTVGYLPATELALLPCDLAATQAYAEIPAAQRLKPLDALHLATAAAAQVDLFVTPDTKLLPRTLLGIGAIVGTSYTFS